MEWLGDSNLKPLQNIKEEDSSTTLHASTDPSISPEQSMESFCDTTESTEERGTAETSVTMLDTSGVDRNIERVKEENPLQTSAEEEKLENANSENVLKDDSEKGCMNLQEQASTSCNEIDDACSLEKDIGPTENRTSNEIAKKSCEAATEMSLEMNSEQDVASSGNVSNELVSSCDTICNDDVILSSSQNPGLPNMDISLGVTGDSGQVTNDAPSLEMSSTPKLAPYRNVEGEQEIEMDKEGYREGISKDSGIHESKEDVREGDSGDPRWIDQQDGKLACLRVVFTCASLVFACTSFVFTCSNFGYPCLSFVHSCSSSISRAELLFLRGQYLSFSCSNCLLYAQIFMAT